MTSSISGTSSTTETQSLLALLKTQATSSSSSTEATSGSMPPPPPECDLSQGGSLLSKLQDLKEEDSEEFTSTLTSISEDLADQAAATDDEQEKALLTDLSEKFGTAAETGDLSALQPPAPPEQYGEISDQNMRSFMESSSTSSTDGTDSGASMRSIMDGIMSTIDEALAK
jgi:hypothetical protein